jgi:hypothetical protein
VPRTPRDDQPLVSDPNDSDVGDIFAGCFLSIAGSLVGALIGAVALVVRTLPELDIVRLLLSVVAGFAGGVFVGFVTTFATAPLANWLSRRIGRTRAENIWIGTVAVAAAIGAAVVPWGVIADS